MLLRLIALFVTIPVVELLLLLEVGKRLGLAATVVLVIGTGVLGAALTRHQGLRVVAQLRQQMQQGVPPAATMIEGLLILVAGAVLLTPGLLTDLCGFALLVPAIRHRIRERLQRALIGRMRPAPPPDVIDVEWREES